jgi:hypothetical protein
MNESFNGFNAKSRNLREMISYKGKGSCPKIGTVWYGRNSNFGTSIIVRENSGGSPKGDRIGIEQYQMLKAGKRVYFIFCFENQGCGSSMDFTGCVKVKGWEFRFPLLWPHPEVSVPTLPN